MNTITWRDILPPHGVVGILGKRREGKSALSYSLAELRHEITGAEAAVLGPPVSMQDKMPPWVHIVEDLQAFTRYPGATTLLDEGSLDLHARQALNKDHTGFDTQLSLCGQMKQLFVVCTHHSRKLDLNVVSEYDLLAFKRPGKMQMRLERREVREFSEKARNFFAGMDSAERKRWAYVYYDDLDEEVALENPLPSFWTQEISEAVSIRQLEESQRRDDDDAVLRGAMEAARATDYIYELDEAMRQLASTAVSIWNAEPDTRVEIMRIRNSLIEPACFKNEPWSVSCQTRIVDALTTLAGKSATTDRALMSIAARIAQLTAPQASAITLP